MKKKTLKSSALCYVLLVLILFVPCISANAQNADSIRHEVLLKTDKGNIRIALYNETPQHRDNFIKLVKAGFMTVCSSTVSSVVS